MLCLVSPAVLFRFMEIVILHLKIKIIYKIDNRFGKFISSLGQEISHLIFTIIAVFFI